MKTRVVITGLGIISPIGIGKDAFWASCVAGKSGVGKLTFFDASQYACQIDAEVKDFNPEDFIEKKKIRRMDRFAQFGFAAAKLAVEDSKIDFGKDDPYRAGIIIGSGIGGLSTLEREHTSLIQKGPGRISPFLIPMMISNIAAGEVAIHYGLRGVNYSVTSACATSAHAIGDALRMIQYGSADVILAGGSDASITPIGFGGFCAIKSLSTRNDEPQKASRPFDKDRDGFVMGEGAGVMVLESMEHALKRGATIYAELAGYGATDDAYHITAPSPDGQSAAKAMEIAMQDACVKPQEVDYINAHGTSTILNDKTETLAIKNVLGEHAKKVSISSTKSMTGHLLGAAGVVELSACVMSIESGVIAPTINYETPDPECDLDYVPNKAREKQVNVAMSNSFGFGGHNAVVVVKKYKK
ncbi:MAG: beta-ketoacyl-ACP synthase II [bacterium]